jgi:hypothetical protein
MSGLWANCPNKMCGRQPIGRDGARKTELIHHWKGQLWFLIYFMLPLYYTLLLLVLRYSLPSPQSKQLQHDALLT